MNESMKEQALSLFSELEPITPALCKELIKKGFKQDDLDTFKRYGYGFNRLRNSFVMIA